MISPELEKLFRETAPKPGCPGTRIDSEGREWYSAAWIDYHPQIANDSSPHLYALPVPSCPRCRSNEVAIGLDADEDPTGEFQCERCGLEFDA